jgi:hypothetical protein
MARKFERCEDLPSGRGGHNWLEMGYWWVELGEENSIHGTEATRDELLKIVFGLWDHIKNYCPDMARAENWALEWIQFLPAKRGEQEVYRSTCPHAEGDRSRR